MCAKGRQQTSAHQTVATATTTALRVDDGTMAARNAQLTSTASEYGSDMDVAVTAPSDYGSEIGLEDLDQDTLLAGAFESIAASRPAERGVVLPSIEFEEGEREDEEGGEDVDGFVQVHQPSRLRIARHRNRDAGAASQLTAVHVRSSPLREPAALEVEYDERSRRAWSVPLEDPAVSARPPSQSKSKTPTSPSQADKLSSTTAIANVAEQDPRPPLERFRTKPMKPLSVTDLVSPAWCELQYFYTLSKFGRKPRTHAMRTGSKIHQKLEDEVHTTVPVQVQTKEDRFGLRMWNAVSGLRCLRETGLTRELEVWGVLEGQVVNGVIDELSYTCPNTAFEEQLERARAERDGGVVPLAPDQTTIEQAFANSSSSSSSSSQANSNAWTHSTEKDRQIYIADVKTRSVRSLPAGASLRPTWMQLMLYRKLLESLTLNIVDAETVFARYDVRPLDSFTPTFLDEIGGIGPDNEASNFPNLLSLWALLITEMQLTIAPTNLSPILRAEFRYAKTGDVIGDELTVYEADIIDTYVSQEMAWWKGTREAKGVELDEAFKCRICDFAEDCSWRKTKIEEATEKSRLRRQAREKSAI